MVKMQKDAEEEVNQDNDKISKKKKLFALLIIINILLVSFIVLWYFYLRPWSIRDVAASANVEINEDADLFGGGMDAENPGFSHDLAGKSKIVKGQVTYVSSFMTTLGPITYYEMDDFSQIRLIDWDYPKYDIGDEIEKEVHFEWSHWNNVRNVYSPQLDFPALGYAPNIGEVMYRVSFISGLILDLNITSSVNKVKLEVYTPKGEGFPLDLFRCSLIAGERCWSNDYLDAGRGSFIVEGSEHEDIKIMDSMDTISNITGENNVITFSDANGNGLLDNKDYFIFNLSVPESDSAVLTYVFSINGAPNSHQRTVLGGLAYIVMTNKGPLRYLSSITEEPNLRAFLIPRIKSEQLTQNGISTTIEIGHVNEPAMDFSNLYWMIIDNGRGFTMGYEQLINGSFISGFGITVGFTDNNHNGLLDEGDIFEVSGLENLAEYDLKVCIGIIDEGLVSVEYSIMEIHWQTGIGAFTGYFPVIDYGDPILSEHQNNTTCEIRIERMFGIPGVNLTDIPRTYWIMTRLVKDTQEILSASNLTFDFEMDLSEVNISFYDIDKNNYINSDDSFICQILETGEYTLILDYVENETDVENGYEIIYSQSVSWTI